MSASASVRERLEEFVNTFDNPEISAMSRISHILQELPDDAARLRVMRWSFSRFSEEFKRPLADAPSPSPTPQAAAPPASSPAPVLVMPRSIEPRPIQATEDDFTRQVAELKDFFGDT